MLQLQTFRFFRLTNTALALIILVISFLFFSQTVHAVTIFSPLIEMEIEPGQNQSGVVKIYNETQQDLFLNSSIESFAAGDEIGQPIYLPLDQKDSHLNWFKIAEDSIILKPGQVALVPFTISVPVKATPGGYYAVIFWQTEPGAISANNEVGVSSKVGTLVFLKVKGEVVEQGKILEFKTQAKQKYFFGLPINFLMRFENTGNIHLKPNGSIEIKGLFSKAVLPVNSQKRNVLPGSIRRFEFIWGQDIAGNWIQKNLASLKQELKYFTIGSFSANLTLNYGIDNNQVIIESVDFWLIPYRLIIFVIIIIVILIIFFKINKKIKKIKQSGTKKV